VSGRAGAVARERLDERAERTPGLAADRYHMADVHDTGNPFAD
jgi:hypothetical protein